MRSEGGGSKKRAWAAFNVILNLFILCIFKYFNFFAESFANLLKCFGLQVDVVTLYLVLPVGISFYTFQALSYTIDVYRGNVKATRDPIAFFAFISFFPQLVAGPIERATNLLPQFLKPRTFDYALAVEGMKQILWGLFKKMIIADRCADIVNKVWANYTDHNTYMLVLAAFLFAFQIYGDFSGYSDIAIGTSKLFGVRLMTNFRTPYFSTSIAEFWRRWHISLNTWFVDYVYIPLGGSRKGYAKKFRNTLIIFLLSGVWHGANWTFFFWGLYHALLFLPIMLLGKTKNKISAIDCKIVISNYPKIFFKITVTFLLVVFGWIIFRANSIHDFCCFIQSIFQNLYIEEVINFPKKTCAFIFIMLLIEWFTRNKKFGLDFYVPTRILRWLMYLAFIFVMLIYAGNQSEFIYFQF